MKPTVVVVSHTHWDREWYQPFEVFRLRLCDMVSQLLDILDREAQFRHFMLDGQTICLDDVLEIHPDLRSRLQRHIDAGRISVGPWYVLQDEFLVGAESIVRNLSQGLLRARDFGRAMRVGYLPDAFGHIAQMPRILSGFGLETAVVWRGVGDASPGSEWRWRAPGGAEVLCLFLPGGYGNAAALGDDAIKVIERLRNDLSTVLPLSRARVLLWMNGNDHQSADAKVPYLLSAVTQALPEVDVEHASLQRAAELVRARVDVNALPVVDGELRRATPAVPVLSGTWSSRSWQKRDHDRAESLLVRFVEPFVALANRSRCDELSQAWKSLLQCQPHDSICGCSIDEVHRDVANRLHRVEQLGQALLKDAIDALVGIHTPDFALHLAIGVVNPHPFPITAMAEVEIQRSRADMPFRLVGPMGEVPYEIIARAPTDGPDRRPAEWLRLRLYCCDIPSHGLRTIAIEPGAPMPFPTPPSTLDVHAIPGGIEIRDRESGLKLTHTVEDEGDRGDLYDFCPVDNEPAQSSRDHHLGIHLAARAVGRRVEIDVDIDNRRGDHRLRARVEASDSPREMWTETAFGWLARATPGTHPTSAITRTASFVLGGQGLHEVELRDGAILLTLMRAVGWMSRGDLSTRPGHAGYNVQTPDAQGLGHQRFRYCIAVGDEAVRALEPGILGPQAIALGKAPPGDRAFLSLEPASARLSILKRADDGDGFILRVCGSASEDVDARIGWFRAVTRASWSELDERPGDAIALGPARDAITIRIPANEVVTLRIE